MLLKWTKTSLPSGLMMKPKPFFESNHLTLPVGIASSHTKRRPRALDVPDETCDERRQREERTPWPAQTTRGALSTVLERCRHPSSPDVLARGCPKPQAKRV